MIVSMTAQKDFTIELISPESIDEANIMRLNSWLDTYVNEQAGVTREWIEERNKLQMSDEYRAWRLKRFKNPKAIGWVAKDHTGAVIGMATPYIDDEDVQHVGSLYVDKK